MMSGEPGCDYYGPDPYEDEPGSMLCEICGYYYNGEEIHDCDIDRDE